MLRPFRGREGEGGGTERLKGKVVMEVEVCVPECLGEGRGEAEGCTL